MDEQRTLHVEPSAQAEQFPAVDETTKNKMLEWLISDVRLLRPMNQRQRDELKKSFAQYCRSGVLFADLANRLSGKNDVVRGIHRTQTNPSNIQANFLKLLGYFKQFSKFNPRYLWYHQEMMVGNEDVIWGFLEDIWYWTKGRISPHDPVNKGQPANKRSSSRQSNNSKKNVERPRP